MPRGRKAAAAPAPETEAPEGSGAQPLATAETEQGAEPPLQPEQSGGSALVRAVSLSPAVAFAEGAAEDLIKKIEAEVAGWKFDVTTKAGRDACISGAMSIRRTKASLDKMGMALTEADRKRIARVNEERKRIDERLTALAESVRAPVTAWEDRDKARVAGHQSAIAAIEDLRRDIPRDEAGVAERLAALNAMPERDWEEFKDKAEQLLLEVESALGDALELAQLRAAKAKQEQEERDRRAEEARQAAEAERARREEEIAREAAEKARRETQEAAEAARVAAERQAAEALAAQARAEQEAREAQERLEGNRVAGHREALARFHGIESITTSAAATAIIDQLRAHLAGRDWQEFAEDAAKEAAAAIGDLELIRDRLKKAEDEAAQQAEARRVQTHMDALAAIAEPEGYGKTETHADLLARLRYLRNYPHRDWQEFHSRAMEAIQAEIDRTEALAATALERENKERAEHDARIREEARTEAATAAPAPTAARAPRAGDKVPVDRQRTVHNEIAAAISACGVPDAKAKAITGKIARGEVPHVSITY